MSKISVTTIAGLTSGGDANKVKIESGDDFTVDTNTLHVNSSTNRVGIGTTSPNNPLEIAHTGSAGAGGLRIGDPSTIASDTGIYLRTTGDAVIGAAGGDIVFDTNMAVQEDMRINSSGHVTMPRQPLANAYYNAATQDGAYASSNRNNVICKPGATHVNVGNMYNSSTGRFTVPVAGRYLAMVSGSQYSQNVSSYWMIHIQKNGSNQRSIYQTKDVTWEQLTGYTVFDCAANDYITFFNHNDSNSAADRGGWDVNAYTNFMVYLLS